MAIAKWRVVPNQAIKTIENWKKGTWFWLGMAIVARMTVRQGVSLVGFIHGVISDKTGGKFAAVVPSTEIAPLLEFSVPPDPR